MSLIFDSINDALVTIGTGMAIWMMIGLALFIYVIFFDKSKSESSPIKKNLRQIANLEILDLLRERVLNHPDERFGQALRNAGIINDVGVKDSSKPDWETPDYYIDRIILHEEPSVILARMRRAQAGEYEDPKIK